MKQQIEQKLNRLNHLAQTAQNPKIVLEEIRLISAEAFELQDELMCLLSEAEATETDIKIVQTLFTTREAVWDSVNQIALREKEIKESHSSREAFKKHQSDSQKQSEQTPKNCCCEKEHCCSHSKEHPSSHKCCQSHHHKEGHCCCHHTTEE